jgi:hypothetical protein
LRRCGLAASSALRWRFAAAATVSLDGDWR